jgi:GTP-binding protein EngB required for normal cell division
LIVSTKADKLSKNVLQKSMASAAKLLETSKIVTYSAQTNLGREELWSEINGAMIKT